MADCQCSLSKMLNDSVQSFHSVITISGTLVSLQLHRGTSGNGGTPSHIRDKPERERETNKRRKYDESSGHFILLSQALVFLLQGYNSSLWFSLLKISVG